MSHEDTQLFFSPSHSPKIERAGWLSQHPVRDEKVHVVTREWFDALVAERDGHRKTIELLTEEINAIQRERDEAEAENQRLRDALERFTDLRERYREHEERDALYEALLWISEYPNRRIPPEPDALVLAEYARAALAGVSDGNSGENQQ